MGAGRSVLTMLGGYPKKVGRRLQQRIQGDLKTPIGHGKEVLDPLYPRQILR